MFEIYQTAFNAGMESSQISSLHQNRSTLTGVETRMPENRTRHPCGPLINGQGYSFESFPNKNEDTLVLGENLELVDIDNLDVVLNNADAEEENPLYSHTEKLIGEIAEDTEYIKNSVQ